MKVYLKTPDIRPGEEWALSRHELDLIIRQTQGDGRKPRRGAPPQGLTLLPLVCADQPGRGLGFLRLRPGLSPRGPAPPAGSPHSLGLRTGREQCSSSQDSAVRCSSSRLLVDTTPLKDSNSGLMMTLNCTALGLKKP